MSYTVAWLTWDSLYRPGWPQTHSGPPNSDSWMLGLNVYTTKSSLIFIFIDNHSDQVKWDHKIVLNYIFLKASDVEQFINAYWPFYFVFWELQLKNLCMDGKISILSVWFFHFFLCAIVITLMQTLASFHSVECLYSLLIVYYGETCTLHITLVSYRDYFLCYCSLLYIQKTLAKSISWNYSLIFSHSSFSVSGFKLRSLMQLNRLL